MNASKIIKEDMTLEEKLAAIDSAMAEVSAKTNAERNSEVSDIAPNDPSLLTICDGCE